MKRRTFLFQSSMITTGTALINTLPSFAHNIFKPVKQRSAPGLYELFKDPATAYRPFVRWWWNGDKIEKKELLRELHLLKEAGIGGVEINPIKFPARTDDMGIPSLQWLSPEWIDALQFTFTEAKALGITCDLLVGSGWPLGGPFLQGEERAQVVLIGTKKLEGAMDFEASLFDLFKEADPAISSPYARRSMEILSVKLVPDPLKGLDDVKDLSDQVKNNYISFSIPKGKYVLYSLVKISGFLEVINGAPGANGPVLNHYNGKAVKNYLDHMSDTIQQKIGPLSKHIRSFFTDSLELEGANWTSDMPDQFKQRRGYDLWPYLPFIHFKIGSMGNVFDYNYGAQLETEMKDTIQRVRYDFDLTKTELLQERFINTFTNWCKENNVKSRVQAYGRGYFPLEGSLDIDIPECETWIKYGIGKEMSEIDPAVGRAYTMINKYVSSAAHLAGKRVISCEELTNTDMVFNATLEVLKIAGDQSTISGVTHPVFHGFNYSPLSAPFPGWIRYGTFLNERNNWWPYIKQFTDYKARIAALLQQADMFADIAILPPVADMWSKYGAQNEPFPSFLYPSYLSLVWEAIHQNGNSCDYISETIIKAAEMKEGHMWYGPRKYHTIFLIEIESLDPMTARKLLSFLHAGGTIFCVETYPNKSPGFNNYLQRDKEVQDLVETMKRLPARFIFLNKPEKDYLQWYKKLQVEYSISPYVRIREPNKFITQVRYQASNTEMLFFVNSSADDGFTIEITASEMGKGKQPWIWNPENGERYKLEAGNAITLDLGPAASTLVVFDHTKKGKSFKPRTAAILPVVINNWMVEFRHIDQSTKKIVMGVLKDLKDIPEFVSFSGTAIYTTNVHITDTKKITYMDLGKVFGISELIINGKSAGSQWYGRRIYEITNLVQTGNNVVDIKVVTTMGNYMKTLQDNAVAQYWTNEKRKNQPIQSMGLLGPVTLM